MMATGAQGAGGDYELADVADGRPWSHAGAGCPFLQVCQGENPGTVSIAIRTRQSGFTRCWKLLWEAKSGWPTMSIQLQTWPPSPGSMPHPLQVSLTISVMAVFQAITCFHICNVFFTGRLHSAFLSQIPVCQMHHAPTHKHLSLIRVPW